MVKNSLMSGTCRTEIFFARGKKQDLFKLLKKEKKCTLHNMDYIAEHWCACQIKWFRNCLSRSRLFLGVSCCCCGGWTWVRWQMQRLKQWRRRNDVTCCNLTGERLSERKFNFDPPKSRKDRMLLLLSAMSVVVFALMERLFALAQQQCLMCTCF